MMSMRPAAGIAFAAAVGLWPTLAQAQDHPARNVTFIVPTGAGAAIAQRIPKWDEAGGPW